MEEEKIKIIKRNDRGFHQYGDPIVCTYGSRIEVYESSIADGPHCWIQIFCDPRMLPNQPSGRGVAHLNEEQARGLIARLQAWLDEIPSRWNFDAEDKAAREGKKNG